MPKKYGPGDFVPAGAMLEAARGPSAGHNGSYKPGHVVPVTIRAVVRNGRLIYEYYGPTDLQPGTYDATLVVVK